MADKISRYLILIYLVGADSIRLQYLVPRLQDGLQRMSVDRDDHLLAFHTPGRETLAYLLRTKLVASQIRTRLTAPEDSWLNVKTYTRDKTAILAHNDEILVIEIGTDFAVSNRGGVDAWLRHHIGQIV